MEKKILEEVLRMRLLSNYDMKSTLTENKEVILERGAVEDLGKAAKSADEIARLERELLQTSGKEFKSALEQSSSLKKLTVTGKDGITAYRTADEIIGALKAGKLAPIEAGRVYMEVFRNSKDPALLKAVSEKIMRSPSWVTKYGNLNKEGFFRLIQKEKNMGPQQVEALWQANRKRLSNVDNVVDAGRKVDDVVDAGRKADDVVDASRGGVNQSQSVVVNNYVGGFKDADDLARRIGPDVDDIARQNKFKDANDWFKKDPEGMYSYARTEGKSGRGVFGKIINWGKRKIKWKALWTLAKIAGVSYGVWWLFFKKDGFTVECEEGQHFEEGKGCIPDGGGGGGGGGGGNTDDNKKTEDKGPNGENLKDSAGNKYEICDEPYYKGCVNKKGNTDIRKVQDCLGVTPNGFFNQETEDALKNKTGKKSFSSSDISTICAKSYGGGSFQI